MRSETERYGHLTLLPVTARAVWRQQDVGLTITEYKIVARLASQKGEPLTYRAIYDIAHYEGFVAGSGEHGYNTNVRSIMKRIRKKFLAVDPAFAEIKNEGDFGYGWGEAKF
jgi:two-component system response regulator ChvI